MESPSPTTREFVFESNGVKVGIEVSAEDTLAKVRNLILEEMDFELDSAVFPGDDFAFEINGLWILAGQESKKNAFALLDEEAKVELIPRSNIKRKSASSSHSNEISPPQAAASSSSHSASNNETTGISEVEWTKSNVSTSVTPTTDAKTRNESCDENDAASQVDDYCAENDTNNESSTREESAMDNGNRSQEPAAKTESKGTDAGEECVELPQQRQMKEEFENTKQEVLDSLPEEVKSRFGKQFFSKWSNRMMPCLVLNPCNAPPGAVRDTWFDMYEKLKKQGRLGAISNLVYWYGSYDFPQNTYSLVGSNKLIAYAEGKKKNMHKVPIPIQKKLEAGKTLGVAGQKLVEGLAEMEEDRIKEPDERRGRMTKAGTPARPDEITEAGGHSADDTNNESPTQKGESAVDNDENRSLKPESKTENKEACAGEEWIELPDQTNGDIDADLSPEQLQMKEEFEKTKQEVLGSLPEEVKSRFGKQFFSRWGNRMMPCLVLSPYNVPPGGVRDMWFDMYEKLQKQGRLGAVSNLVYWYGSYDFPQNAYSLVGSNKLITYAEGEKKNMHKVPIPMQKKLEAGKTLGVAGQKLVEGLAEMEEDRKKEPDERRGRMTKAVATNVGGTPAKPDEMTEADHSADDTNNESPTQKGESAVDNENRSQETESKTENKEAEWIELPDQTSGEIDADLSPEQRQTKEEFEKTKQEVLDSLPEEVKSRFGKQFFSKWGNRMMPCLVLNPYNVPPGGVRDTWFDMYEKLKKQDRLGAVSNLVYWYGSYDFPQNAYSLVGSNKLITYAEGEKKNMHKVPNPMQKKLEAGQKLGVAGQKFVEGLAEMEEDRQKEPDERHGRMKHCLGV